MAGIHQIPHRFYCTSLCRFYDRKNIQSRITKRFGCSWREGVNEFWTINNSSISRRLISRDGNIVFKDVSKLRLLAWIEPLPFAQGSWEWLAFMAEEFLEITFPVLAWFKEFSELLAIVFQDILFSWYSWWWLLSEEVCLSFLDGIIQRWFFSLHPC